MITLTKFYEKLSIAFTTSNKNIIKRISCQEYDKELVIEIKKEKQGLIKCINSKLLKIKPFEKHKMEIEEVWDGYDGDGSCWSDHMGGHVIDCTGKNVDEAINLIVTKINELVKD